MTELEHPSIFLMVLRAIPEVKEENQIVDELNLGNVFIILLLIALVVLYSVVIQLKKLNQ